MDFTKSTRNTVSRFQGAASKDVSGCYFTLMTYFVAKDYNVSRQLLMSNLAMK